MKKEIIGIMGAMPEEINGVLELLADRQETKLGGRTYYTGTIHDKKVVVVFSKWGKVAATITATTLILKFGITKLIFTGVAGAIHSDLKIGDIVVGTALVQHDMDARPLVKQYELPSIGRIFLECDAEIVNHAMKTIDSFLQPDLFQELFKDEDLGKFNITTPQLHLGDIASGDQFFSSITQKESLKAKLPSILCVEMEGAAVAQVCYEYQIPWLIIRTISDTSDDKSQIDFPAFIERIASKYSQEIIRKILA